MTQFALRLLALAALLWPVPGLAQVVASDDFQDETPGTAPVAPDVGSYGTLFGAPTVFDAGSGNLRVRITDSVSDGGGVLSYQPTEAIDSVTIEYLFRIESGVTLSGTNAFVHNFIFFPPGSGISLRWSNTGDVSLNVRGEGGTEDFTVIGFAWDFGDDYPIAIEVDATTSRYTVSFLGAKLVDRPLPGTMTTLQGFSFATNFPTRATFQIDDVRAAPEPGAAVGLGGALVSLAWLAARRSERGGTGELLRARPRLPGITRRDRGAA